VVKNHQAIVEVLDQAGADINILNKYNYTPLNLAQEEELTELAQYLSGIGAAANKHTISLNDRRKAKALYEQASPYFQKNKYQKAIPLLDQAITLNPLYGLAHHGLAIIYLYHAKKYQLAEEHILRSIELSPDDVESYYTAGRVYYSLGKMQASKPFFQKYIGLAPDTYNTQDLKKNYAHLLVPGDQSREVRLREKSLLNQYVFLLSEYKQFLIAGLSILLLILLMVRLKKHRNKRLNR
jgi:tetratricopeptide (TPR) repeat protein